MKIFQYMDQLDIGPIIAECAACPEYVWRVEKFWTDTPADAPSPPNTNIIGQRYNSNQIRLHLRWNKDLPNGQEWWRNPEWRKDYNIGDTKNVELFPNTMKLLQNYFEVKLGGELQKVFFSRMDSGEVLVRHTDTTDDYYQAMKRFALVITTNEHCRFTLEDRDYWWPPGTLVWFDNTKVHSAVNAGMTNRIHLIIDVKIGDDILDNEPYWPESKFAYIQTN